MEQLKISHQTLREFIESPFGNPDNQKRLQYEDRYQKYKRNNKIRVEATLEIDKNYFIHLKVPSESQKGTTVYYDVVVQFFTTNSEVEKELNLRNYYVQFFSNSPGFVYQYATLYRIEGYLIETLTDKFTPGALEVLPDKANKDYKLYYDSTIYYACRYLQDNRMVILGKLNFKIFRRKTTENFFKDIQSFEYVNLDRDISKLEQGIREEIAKDTALSKKDELKLQKNKQIGRDIRKKKEARMSTFKDPSAETKIIKAGRSTKNRSIKVIRPKPKKGHR